MIEKIILSFTQNFSKDSMTPKMELELKSAKYLKFSLTKFQTHGPHRFTNIP